jgi:predicted chitinase
MKLYYGVVENRDDPLKLGRCQVRVVGMHTHDKAILPTADLPWATPMQPVTSAAMNGIGWSPVGPVPGTTVIITYADVSEQQPIMLGTLGGIPQSKDAALATEDSGNIATDGGVVVTTDGEPVKKTDGTPVTLGNRVESEKNKLTTGIVQEVKDITNKITAGVAAAFGADFSNFFGLDGQKTSVGQAKEQLVLPVTGADKDGQRTVIPPKPAATETKIDAQPEPGKADPVILKTEINPTPPPKYVLKGEATKAKECCQAIIEACDKVGLTSKYAKCAILGIIGGESAFVPREEWHVYNKPETLLQLFPTAFKGDMALAQKYSGGKTSKFDFFEFLYGYTNSVGQGLGNKNPGDGGKYLGRGFNGLTGKYGYAQAQKELAKLGIIVDLVNKPELLNDDIKIAALACAIFYKVNVKHDMNDPGYFAAARKRTGNDANGGYAKKQVIYEYFLGQSVLTESTNKPSAEDKNGKTYTPAEVSQLPQEQQKALLEDRSENSTIGFKDPDGKYPLRNLMNEPDTNRLARGIIKDTAIAFKDQTRSSGIPGVFGSTWEQPLAPFGGKYPYNKVYETESGHVMMFDDTTGHETISIYHKTGSFLDIDSQGTQVNKIIGDGYTIYDRNGMIYVTGKCNLTVGNSVNIMVVGDANIEVNGQTRGVFHGDVNLECATNVNMVVGGDYNLQVDGSYNVKVGVDSTLETAGATTINAGTNFIVNAGEDSSIKAAGDTYLDAGGESNILAGGNVNVDGAEFHGQEGSASAGIELQPSKVSLTAPEYRQGKRDSFEVFTTPVRPAPAVDFKINLDDLDDFYKNPDKYYDPAAEAGGVNATRPPQPDIGSQATTQPPSGAEPSDIQGFLTTQLAKAKEGFWSETGMKRGDPSNPNIIQMWKDIGLAKVGVNDQVPWCMCFINWTLKQCGYRYAQTARAFDMRDKPSLWGATQVTSDPKPGDVIVWRYSHVNFVWKVENGKIYPVGGNQGGGKVSDNNPSGGSVTQSYPNGVPINHKDIVGVYRPSKA